MKVLQAFLLGLVQGVAEFLPISSSGHLAIAKNLMGLNTEIPEFYDILLHMGTLLAILVAYWSDIVDLVREFFAGVRDIARGTTPKNVPAARRLLLLLIVGSLPLFLVLPVHRLITTLSDNMTFVGAALILTGVILLLCDMVRPGCKNARSARLLDVVIIGLSQVVATLPGVSRSGMTIATGCYMGLDRRFAVRFAFLLSIPAVLGANFLTLLDVLKVGVVWAEVPVYMVGVITAAVSGYLCIRLLRYVADKGRFGSFAYYCWAIGLLTLVLNTFK